jgi:osmotically-inducible protein OsmY
MGIYGIIGLSNHLNVEPLNIDSIPTDREIRDIIKDVLRKNRILGKPNIEVSVISGTLTLKGAVDSFWKKSYMINLVRSKPGVIYIRDLIAIVPNEKDNDKDIALRIMDSIGSKVYVETENMCITVNDGDVILTGWAQNWQARKNSHKLVSHVLGVKRVENRLYVKGMELHY